METEFHSVSEPKKEKPAGYVFGRPIEYKPEYCEMLIEHMSKGKSFESFGAVVNCGRATLYNWRRDHSDFLDAFNTAREKHLEYMESLATEHLVEHFQGPKLNTGLYKLFMVNIHGWTSEKQQLANDDQKPFEVAYVPKSMRVKDAG